MFADLGAGIVDTDEISHTLTRADGAAIPLIRSEFGVGYIAEDGSLNRVKMRQLVFANAAARKRLEAILHPLIGQETRARAAASPQSYVILAIPLLLEAGAYRDLIKRIAVVDCTEQQQVERTMQRSGLTEHEVRAIISTQVSRERRLAQADDILNNTGCPVCLRREVELLHSKYLEFARGRQRHP